MKQSAFPLLSILIFSIFLIGCPKEPTVVRGGVQMPMSQAARLDYTLAESYFNKRQFKRAERSFNKFLQTYPTDRYAPFAQVKLGSIYQEKKDKNRAKSTFQRVIERHPTSAASEEAKLALGLMFYEEKDYLNAKSLLASIPRDKLSIPKRIETLNALRDAYRISEEPKSLLRVDIELFDMASVAPDPTLREEVIRIIDENLSEAELEQIVRSRDNQFPAGYAANRLAMINFERGDFGDTERWAKRFLEKHSTHELRPSLEDLVYRIERMNVVDAESVGVVLPLSGKAAWVGKKILAGLLVGAQPYLQREKRVRLIIKDNQGDPDRTKELIEELVLNHNVVAIIGPALQKTTPVAIAQAKQFRVPLLVLSQSENITDESSYVFQNCLTKSDQVKAVARFAIEKMGVRRIAFLYPSHNYGIEMMNLMWDELKKYDDVQVVGAESYQRDANDFRPQVRKLVGLFYLETRKDETCTPNQDPDKDDCFSKDNLPPLVEFEALFVPDTYEQMLKIAPALPLYDVRGVQLLGINLWHSDELVKGSSRRFLQGALFVDDFVAGDPAKQVKSFVSTYKASTKRPPGILEAQAHDSAQLVLSALLNNEVTSRKQMKKALLNLRGYSGVTGVYRFNDEGRAERKLRYLMVDGRYIREIE